LTHRLQNYLPTTSFNSTNGIKNIHLYVKQLNGRVTVSAPLATGDEVMERFIRTKYNWTQEAVVYLLIVEFPKMLYINDFDLIITYILKAL
jgi:hypothetical protein